VGVAVASELEVQPGLDLRLELVWKKFFGERRVRAGSKLKWEQRLSGS
jgi:hypothetical protein